MTHLSHFQAVCADGNQVSFLSLRFVDEPAIIVDSSDFTDEGYRLSTVEKILAAKRAKSASAPRSSESFLDWLQK